MGLKLKYSRSNTSATPLYGLREQEDPSHETVGNFLSSTKTYGAYAYNNFHLKGPNGWHKRLVYELLRPNIPDIIDAHFPRGRLPGKLAKGIVKQSLIGLSSLHQHNVGHGGWPIGYIRRSDGTELGPGIPEYIVRSPILDAVLEFRFHPVDQSN